MYSLQYKSLHFANITSGSVVDACKCVIVECNLVACTSNLVTEEKRQKCFATYDFLQTIRYDAKGNIYLSCHMFSCEHFLNQITTKDLIKKCLPFQHVELSC